MIVIDTNVLCFLFDRNSHAPHDPSTGVQLTDGEERLQIFLKNLKDEKEKLIIPTPVLAEVMIGFDGSIDKFLSVLRKYSVFIIAEFNEMAAIELRAMYQGIGKEKLSELRKETTKHRIKFDLQILAIAKVKNSKEIITDDIGLQKAARLFDIGSRGVADLPLPAEPRFPGI